MRTDARRNRQCLLTAAQRCLVGSGREAPLETVAREAGVGIGTLYRHFPERRALLRAVAVDVLGNTSDALRTAVAEEADAFSALRRYVHDALDLGVGAVMPLIAGEIGDDADVLRARDELASLQTDLVVRARREGSLRVGVEFADIGLVLTRFSRPIGSGFDPELEPAIAHRHLDVFIDGLHAGCTTHELMGPDLSLERLRAMTTGGRA